MMKRIFFLLIVCIVNMTMLTGCWDYKEIDKVSIVAGVAIDKSEQGKYSISTEIVDLHEGGREAKIKSKILESYGDTLYDAIRNAIKIAASKPYWGHVEIVIISQEVAREGIVEIVDLLNRDREPRLSVDLLISKEKTAKEILESQSITTEIRSYEINKMLDGQKDLSKAPIAQIYEFINALSDEGVSAVIPTIGIVINQGEKTSELSGLAVFKQDKLVDFLDENETKAFLFVKNKIKGGLITLKENSESGDANITLEIVDNKTKVKPVYSNGEVSIDIEVKTKTVLGEDGMKENFIEENKSLILEKDAEELLKKNIKNIIQKVQKDFDTDIFGFGKTVREDMPSLWKKIEPNWKDIFKNVKVKVNTSVEIQGSELMSKPIKIGD